jgi:hypothetical protein
MAGSCSINITVPLGYKVLVETETVEIPNAYGDCSLGYFRFYDGDVIDDAFLLGQ